MRYKRFKGLLWLAMVGILLITTESSSGQLLLASGEYRVVDVDSEHARVSVALIEAVPDKHQNWIYITATTKVTKRHTSGDGWFRDEKLSYEGFFNSVRPGDKLRVEGGRRWDGGVTARKIWM